MMNKLAQHFFGAALMLLLSAIAIHAAVGLLMSVWKQLAIIGIIAILISGFVLWVRFRLRGW
jgi:succinate dehydrogenase hydrophobic anchor subunit